MDKIVLRRVLVLAILGLLTVTGLAIWGNWKYEKDVAAAQAAEASKEAFTDKSRIITLKAPEPELIERRINGIHEIRPQRRQRIPVPIPGTGTAPQIIDLQKAPENPWIREL